MFAWLKRLAIRLVIGLVLGIVVVQGLIYWLTTGDGRTWENASTILAFVNERFYGILAVIALLYLWKGAPRKKKEE
jgi:hypothetical protein